MAEAGWQATVLTLFPEMFPGPLGASLAGKSLKEGIWSLKTLDIRQFARDNWKFTTKKFFRNIFKYK